MTTTTDKLAEALRGLAERHGYKASHPSAEVRGLLADDVRAVLAAYDAERAEALAAGMANASAAGDPIFGDCGVMPPPAREPAGAHTPEPWRAEGPAVKSLDGGRWRTIFRHAERNYTPTGQDNDARRVAACVNACAGIQTEALVRGDWWKVGANASAELRAQAVAVIARNSPHMTAAALLVHAYARGEAEGGSVDWDDVNRAWEAACVEVGPERVASIAAMYADDEADA